MFQWLPQQFLLNETEFKRIEIYSVYEKKKKN